MIEEEVPEEEWVAAQESWDDYDWNCILLKRDNDRLRDLLADMWRFMGAACKKYPRLFDPAAQGGQMVQLNAIDAFEQRMSELGVDVDQNDGGLL